ncbi:MULTISPECIES: type II and III secretion system protein family protein [unclassified Pseudodesulfovibrio]|uniref:type II and III secretion system protein family protein n=1 Tax=unclassified Pseudodesulfovibrio TaxID=2661612 RepID=UPI000FEB65D7|nr:MULTISPECIES: type II and III secretion system protein family protein [unclassified Pseudodesulfovibrio]MCJ2164425.1 type II and III secretion system protein family protein [Pseudodesulfovibrio sp. S3-i]RWU04631.1 type II and III secretion system protein family protein [Pseudodesulfovibrio sp. S3]
MQNIRSITTVYAALIVLVVLLAAVTVQAAVYETEAQEEIRLVVGKSTVINTESRISRVSVGSETVVSIVVLSPRQIYLTGTALGSTTLTLWTDGQVSDVFDVAVIPDVTHLKRMIHEILPAEQNVKVLSSGDSVTLSGYVSSTSSLTSVLALAQAAAPDKVVNLLSVDGIHQVMLEVRVAEMSRAVTKRLGINFAAIGSNFSIYSIINNLTSYDAEKGIFNLTDRINFTGGYRSGSTTIHGMIDALKSNGLVRMLAEPNLTCISGESAEFLVGGEVPIPMPGSLGTIAIEYKPYGIGLKFTATVMNSGRINLQVNPEVSELDYSKSVPVAGYEVPTISTRRANTVVELGDGQSFVIAGLISDSLKENSHKFPGLGEIPVLGALFSSKDFSSNKTELVVLVTAHLAKPVDRDSQTLPTDGFQEPDDKEFYLFGLLEGQDSNKGTKAAHTAQVGAAEPGTVVRPESGFDGEFGHSWPK